MMKGKKYRSIGSPAPLTPDVTRSFLLLLPPFIQKEALVTQELNEGITGEINGSSVREKERERERERGLTKNSTGDPISPSTLIHGAAYTCSIIGLRNKKNSC